MREQRAYLNGISIEDVHPAVLLQHIEEMAPDLDVKTGDRTGAPGLFVTSHRIKQRQINLVYAIRERTDFAVRAAAAAAVMAWAAKGGWLEISSRPGLRIRVDVSQQTGPGRLREWTQDLMLTLTAYAFPIWQESVPNAVSLSGVTEDSAYLPVPGTWPTNLEAEITPTAAALTSAEITAGGETMTLSDLSVAAGTTLRIFWDERHLMRITAGTAALLGHRTGSDLRLEPGRQEIGLDLSTACDVKLTARGCYL